MKLAPTSPRGAVLRAPSSSEATPAAYGASADRYDSRTGVFQSSRDRIVNALDPRPGDVVLDVGCGTGLCFEGLRRAVGPTGSVVGIDESPDMVRLARGRVATRRWDNVSVLNASVGQAEIPVVADKILFCAVHDVLQSVEGLRNVLAHVRPGGKVVAGGGKFTSPWLLAMNLQVTTLHKPYVRSFAGFARPWAVLAPFLDELKVSEFALGTGFCAVGRTRARIPKQR